MFRSGQSERNPIARQIQSTKIMEGRGHGPTGDERPVGGDTGVLLTGRVSPLFTATLSPRRRSQPYLAARLVCQSLRSNSQDKDSPGPHQQPCQRVGVQYTNTTNLRFHLQLPASLCNESLCRSLNNSFA